MTVLVDQDTELSARGLRKDFGSDNGLVHAVAGVDLDVRAGESVAIVGASGCAKSTLLYLLGGLERPTGGSLRLGGRQQERLGDRPGTGTAPVVGVRVPGFPSRRRSDRPGKRGVAGSARGGVASGGRVPGPTSVGPGRAGRAGRSSPSALSGGQCQRVAIARALINEPAVLLADEPTGNLDSASTSDVLRLFQRLHSAGQTLVIVTHDDRVAATADRLITMRDGRFVDQTRLSGGRAPGWARSPAWRTEGGTAAAGVASDPRRHPATLAALPADARRPAATSTVTVALALLGVTDSPFTRTRTATKGPDVAGLFEPGFHGTQGTYQQFVAYGTPPVWSVHPGRSPQPPSS